MRERISPHKIDNFIRANYSLFSMNDTKWKKLLNSVGNSYEAGCTDLYKEIYDEEIRRIHFYCADTQFFVELILYKEIEWIEFPSKYEDWINEHHQKIGKETKTQNIYHLKSLVKSLGQFDLEDYGDSIRIYAYR